MTLRLVKKFRWVILLLLGALAILAMGSNFAMQYIQSGVRASYYEWAFVGIIASYTEENCGITPRRWEDLRGYEHHSQHTPSLQTLEEAQHYLSIDFDAIERMKRGQEIESGNRLIVTKRGLDVHWINPRGELERYFEQGVLPSGALSHEEANERRESLEQSQKAIENSRR
jgi:hypothetical protein